MSNVTSATTPPAGRARSPAVRVLIDRVDADGTARRRAIRATLVVPGLFALGLASGSDPLALYALFGAVAHLVFGDYGGPPRERASAYAATTVIGLVLIFAGTAASEHELVAALATVVVTFAITLAGVLGPLVTQLRTPLLLAFILPVSAPAPLSEVWPRLAGWGLAGVVSLAAALVILPRRDDVVVTDLAASACDRLAQALRARAGGQEVAAPPRPDRLASARTLAAASALGPTPRRHALVMLVEELQSFQRLLKELPGSTGADVAAHERLVGAVTTTMHDCGVALRTGGRPDAIALDHARAEHRAAMERWAESALRAGRPAMEVLDALDGEREIRMLSHVALGIAAATTVVEGGALPSEWADVAPRGSRDRAGAIRRGALALRSHLSSQSVRFRDALRAGVAFGAAVLIAGLGGFEHGFWVVLGALSVLRTSVLAGSRTALQAVGGTVVGFLAVIPIVWLTGTATATQWVLMVPCVFIAAFAGSTLPYAVGQAAFTVFVVLAVNLIEPNGWHTGAIRVVDVGAGAAVALVAGVLFWPRGAQVQARVALAALYRATATRMSAAFAHVLLTASSDHGQAVSEDRVALGRARAAVSDLVAERGHNGPGVTAAAQLVVSAAVMATSAERIASFSPLVTEAPPALADGVAAAVAGLSEVADALQSGRAVAAPDLDPETLSARGRQATADRLATGALSPDRRQREDAFVLVWTGHWVVDIARRVADLKPAVDDLSGAAPSRP